MHRAYNRGSQQHKDFKTYLIANLTDQIKTVGHARIHLKNVTAHELRFVSRLAQKHRFSADTAAQSNGDGTFEAYIHLRPANQIRIHLKGITARELSLVEGFAKRYHYHLSQDLPEANDSNLPHVTLTLRQIDKTKSWGKNTAMRAIAFIERIANHHGFHAELDTTEGKEELLGTDINVNRMEHGEMYEANYLHVYNELVRATSERCAKTLHDPIVIPLRFRCSHTAARLVGKLRQRNHVVRLQRGPFSQLTLHFPEGVKPLLH